MEDKFCCVRCVAEVLQTTWNTGSSSSPAGQALMFLSAKIKLKNCTIHIELQCAITEMFIVL